MIDFDKRRAFANLLGATHHASFDGATSHRIHYGVVRPDLMYRTVCKRETAAYENQHMEPGFECGHCRRTLDRLIAEAEA